MCPELPLPVGADQNGTRPRLDPGDQFRKRVGRYLTFAEQQLRIAGDHRDRFEVFQQIIWQRIDGAVEDVCRDVPDAKRIAIRRGASDTADTDTSRCTRHVLDDNGLSKLDRHALSQNAGQRVGRPTGGKRHNHGDRVCRIALGRGQAGRGQPNNTRDYKCQQFGYAAIPRIFSHSIASSVIASK